MNITPNIGFNQRIKLEWLDYTAGLVLAGNTRPDIMAALQDLLKEQLSVGGTAERGNREKAITILLRIWVSGPKELDPLREEGLDLLANANDEEKMALHWGITMATYPFFAQVAETTGRLLALQNNITPAQIQGRIKEQYGERQTVHRAARRIIRTMVDWDVIKDTEEKGIYQRSMIKSLQNEIIVGWLLEALLRANGSETVALSQLVNSPALFAFEFIASSTYFQKRKSIQIYRQGLDQEMVVLI